MEISLDAIKRPFLLASPIYLGLGTLDVERFETSIYILRRLKV
jgi:hypothetical protein